METRIQTTAAPGSLRVRPAAGGAVLAALLLACNGKDADVTPFEASCSGTLTVGTTQVDLCDGAAVAFSGADDDGTRDVQLTLGTDGCSLQLDLDDTCGRGTYWVDGGVWAPWTLTGCAPEAAAAADSGFVFLSAFDVAEGETGLEVTLTGELNLSDEDGTAVVGAFDIQAVVDAPSGAADGAGCANVTRTEAGGAIGGDVDVLFAIDDGPDMAAYQSRLAAAIPGYATLLDSRADSWQAGVITLDDQGGQLRAEGGETVFGSDAAADLAAAVEVGSGPFGAGTGRRAVQAALSEPLLSGANADFLRPDARLAVVVLSNRDDASGEEPKATDFAVFLRNLKPDRKMVSFSSIVAPPRGCTDLVPGNAYLGVTLVVGGGGESVCADSYAGLFGFLSPKANLFPLEEVAVDASVRVVRTDGDAEEPLTRNRQWTWDAPSVVLNDTLAEEGATVSVTYAPRRANPRQEAAEAPDTDAPEEVDTDAADTDTDAG
jgi:hypothetical protein